MEERKFKVACVQATPVFFNVEKTIDKALNLIKKAAEEGNKLIVFPETYIPGYPSGLGFGTVVGSRTAEGRIQFKEYWQNSVEVPGPLTDEIAACAKANNIFVVMGVTERDLVTKTLYCTLIYFGSDGTLLGKHRKIKPTAAERIVWGEGDGTTLTTFDTKFGKIGGLICWENYMPLARMALYSKGVEIYLAPTADSRDSWQATMQHIAFEGRCYVIGCNQYFTKSDYPAHLRDEVAKDKPEVLSRGGSVIVSPMGEVIAGPLFNKEEILSVEIDLDEVVKSRMDFDVTGHYSRNDIFDLKIKDQPEIKKG
ncbi:MAG: carbon-nitrogen hydrolase family protein [Cyclobacteriaceae bacterium]|nr:carbon-nitrogen hydrolase family protein [Cyclobacteriaceae bacterium]